MMFSTSKHLCRLGMATSTVPTIRFRVSGRPYPVGPLLIALILIAAACTAQPGAAPSPTPADASIVAPRTVGITVKPVDTGQADLDGGKYRVAWYAPSCSALTIEWRSGSSGSTAVPVMLPSGDTIVALPAGVGQLDRTATCTNGYTIRFERAP